MSQRSASPILVTLALSAAAIAVYLGVLFFKQKSTPTLPVPMGSVAPLSIENNANVQAGTTSQLVAELPSFSLDNLDGVPTSIDSWPDKAMIINFWATWCAPCLREIPMLKTFQATHADIQVVGIAIDRVKPVLEFAETAQFNYPVLVGPQAMEAAANFGVNYLALPLTIFVAADRSVLSAHMGELEHHDLENLREVLREFDAGDLSLDSAKMRLERRM